MKRGYYWALYGDNNEVVFIYSPTRSRAVIDKFLESFKGVLQSDGYRAYESFCKATGVCWAGCWAHTRRKFIEAEHLAPEKVKKILGELQLLYEIEERGRGKPKLLKGTPRSGGSPYRRPALRSAPSSTPSDRLSSA